MSSRIRAMQMERQLAEMVRAFDGQGVDIIILKGIALAWSHYPDPAARPASDLDILVKPAQMEQARAVLGGLGYRCVYRTFTEVFKDIGCEEVYVHDDGTYRTVELHWDIYTFHRTARDAGIEDLFTRAVMAETPSFSFQALHPVDALVHACIHMIKGHGDHLRLSWVYDVALLAGRLSIPDDWAALQKRCVEWRGRFAVEDALKLAREWAGLNLPHGFDDFSLWPGPSEFEACAGREGRNMDNWLARLLKVYRLNSSKTGATEKARFWLRLVFPNPGHIRNNYPPRHEWLLPVSYVRRWLNWLGRL